MPRCIQFSILNNQAFSSHTHNLLTAKSSRSLDIPNILMLRLHVVTPQPCPQWDLSQPGSRAAPPPTSKVSVFFGFSWTLRSISLIPPPLLFVWSCWLSVGIIKDAFSLETAASLRAGIRLTPMVSRPQPLSELGCASHARPETMTETLRL